MSNAEQSFDRTQLHRLVTQRDMVAYMQKARETKAEADGQKSDGETGNDAK